MGAKDRHSHAQKRKAKLAKRTSRNPSDVPVPYQGTKYQSEHWTPHVFATESAIYEGILASRRTLTNSQVKQALVRLIGYLREGQLALLPEGEPDVPYQPGNEVPYLVWNIRRHWRMLFEEKGIVSSNDLIGILRTLLNSIEAHAWNTGPGRGYVAFLDGFMQRVS